MWLRGGIRNTLAFSVALAVTFTPFVSAFAVEAPVPSNLNLGSTARTYQVQGAAPINIMYGGRVQQVLPGSYVTPAAAVAINQVLSGGRQTLQIGALGNAVGGSAVLNNAQLQSLSIPTGVQVVKNFADGAALNVANAMVNSGAFYAVSTSTASKLASIVAADIVNTRTGLITSVLPTGGLAGFANAIGDLSLSLAAARSITNAGVISSAANLDLVASSGNLAINGTGGTFSAANAINLISNAPSGAVTVNGGTFVSSQFNIEAPKSAVSVYAHSIDGVVNVNACDVHVGQQTGQLTLGAMNISGDPTFFNATGPVFITSDIISNTQGIAIFAKGDIDFQPSAGTPIVRVQTGANASPLNITLVAGANLVATPPAIGNQNPTAITGGTVKVTGPSDTGGNITCTTCGNAYNGTFQINTVNNGGSITMAAYKSTGVPVGTTGAIDLTAGLVSSGNSNGAAGNITVIAPNTIGLGQVFGDGTKGTPTLTVSSSQATGTITADATGKVTGALKPSTLDTTDGHVTVQNLVQMTAGKINIDAGVDLVMGPLGILNAGGNMVNHNGGAITIAAPSMTLKFLLATGNAPGGSGGQITLNSSGAINGVSGSLDVSGTIGAVGVVGAAGKAGTNGGAGGAGGTITIKADSVNFGTGFGLNSNGGDGNIGGNGGNQGASTVAGLAGGNGGAGGAGGKGGTINITTVGDATLASVQAVGGGGQKGGDGGTGSNPSTGAGGKGGNGGTGGAGGLGGKINITAGNALTLSKDILASGGAGGFGGIGGDGGSPTTSGNGGAGGNGGTGGAAGAGGNIVFVAGANQTPGLAAITFSQVLDVNACGGAGFNSSAGDNRGPSMGFGGIGGPAGAGGNSIDGTGGNAGNGGTGGAGAKGGTISVTVKNGDLEVDTNVSQFGANLTANGAGGGDGGVAKNGGTGGKLGGNGSKGGNGGNGAIGGNITVAVPNGAIKSNFPGDTSGFLQGEAFGGIGGEGRDGGNGGGGSGSAGNGGAGGNGGNGANGGTTKFSSASIDANIQMYDNNPNSVIPASGGNGGRGGNGGTLTNLVATGKGGNGGVGGNGGKAGNGGIYSLSATGDMDLRFDSEIYVEGGNGGVGGNGGDGSSAGNGPNAFGNGGNGGNGGKGGAGGLAPSASIISKSGFIKLGDTADGANVELDPGLGGDGGAGGNGGAGIGDSSKVAKAGNGGNGGGGGNAGAAGLITITAMNDLSLSGSAYIHSGVGNTISGSGGGGGTGGSFIGASPVTGGNSGNGGNAGLTATSGGIKLTSTLGNILMGYDGAGGGTKIESHAAKAGDGGDSQAAGAGIGIGGLGGTGGKGGNGTAGSTPGAVVLSAKNGAIDFNTTFSASISSFINAFGSFGGNGGAGGTGGDSNDKGGNGGNAGNGAAGGKGGTINIIAKDDIRLGNLDAGGAAGGFGFGVPGDGGSSLLGSRGTGGNGGNAGVGGAGGIGGNITVTSSAGNILTAVPNPGGPVQTNIINASGGNGGDIGGGNGGKGGTGGTVDGAGGNGGNGAIGGNGGTAGIIKLTAKNDIMAATGNITEFSFLANGGAGGGGDAAGGAGGSGFSKGGNGGRAGNTGSGGTGGQITVSANFVKQVNVEVSGGDGASAVLVGGDAGNPMNADPNAKIAGAKGGDAGTAGSGGNAGKVSITAPGGISFGTGTWDASGGTGGTLNGGSKGGVGGGGSGSGGAGGSGGKVGAGGVGGTIKLSSTQGDVDTTSTSILMNGGSAGASLANGGNGGQSLTGAGGNGGAMTVLTAGGKGGSLDLSTTSGGILLGAVDVKGGSAAFLDGGQGGDGGSSPGTKGGNGGSSSGLVAGADGGKITLKQTTVSAGDIQISGGLTLYGGDASAMVNGARFGNGGDGGTTGGNAGGISKTANGGKGGSMAVNSPNDVKLGLIQVNVAGGIGGTPALPGTPGDGSIPGARVLAIPGGVGGQGGSLDVTAGAQIDSSARVFANGGDGGIGGRGGGGPIAGGFGIQTAGVTGGAGGAGGAGGSVNFTADNVVLQAGVSGKINVSGGLGANGGNGGDSTGSQNKTGGVAIAGANGGAGGVGGAGGTVKLVARIGSVFANEVGLVLADGGDGGLGGTGGKGADSNVLGIGPGGTAGAGGLGGVGGIGGKGGTITAKSPAAATIFATALSATGGDAGGGGNGGSGGAGTDANSDGGKGGAGGAGAAGGNGGTIFVPSTFVQIINPASVAGGAPSNGGSGGSGGAGNPAGANGASGANSTKQGDNGKILPVSDVELVTDFVLDTDADET